MDNPGQDYRELPPHHEMMEIFEELSFREKVSRTIRGLREPRDSGDYKYARLQILRLLSPVSAVIVPCVMVTLIAFFAQIAPPTAREVEVRVLDPETPEELEDLQELIEDQMEPPEPMDFEFTDNAVTLSEDPTPTPQTELSPQPAAFDSVALVKSPVIMRGIYGSRNPGSRGTAIRRHGGNERLVEGAVLRALRWLKKTQQADGSWNPPDAMAMTGLGLLTFLAHGETPASKEFGGTVEKAIQYLLGKQKGSGHWGSSYTHAIVTYAICETYALTRVPMLKDAAARGLDVIIRGQNPGGGWNYPLQPCDRNDTSVMGWCAQALKAGKMARLKNEGLDNAMRHAVTGFKNNAHPDGGFGYTSPGQGGLSGVGVLCMQLLGAGKQDEAKRGLLYLEDHHLFDWGEGPTWSQIYYWYYITQAKFHEGGKVWRAWNRSFASSLIKEQTVLKGQGVDGKDIGFWTTAETKGDVMDTTLCALMLEVYYRYLPTYKPPKEINFEEEALGEDDIPVDIELPGA